ncbi:MAG: hypothetical protein AB9917_22850 [Negativicutes bacterium]
MKPLIGVTCKYSYDGRFAVEQGMGVRGQQWHLLPTIISMQSNWLAEFR